MALMLISFFFFVEKTKENKNKYVTNSGTHAINVRANWTPRNEREKRQMRHKQIKITMKEKGARITMHNHLMEICAGVFCPHLLLVVSARAASNTNTEWNVNRKHIQAYEGWKIVPASQQIPSTFGSLVAFYPIPISFLFLFFVLLLHFLFSLFIRM